MVEVVYGYLFPKVLCIWFHRYEHLFSEVLEYGVWGTINCTTHQVRIIINKLLLLDIPKHEIIIIYAEVTPVT